MQRFERKNVLVTGGNSGIGLAAALAFAREGARVVITGRDQATLDKAAAQLGENAVSVRNDAGSVTDGTKLATLLQQQNLMLDAIFINAGVAKLAPFEAVDDEMWDVSFNTNVKGPYFLIKALIPCLNPGAAIVLNGSINAHIGMLNTSVYAASKAALISLAKTLSAELLTKGIRVNVVSAGPVRTPLLSRLGLPAKQLSEVEGSILAQIPLKRFGMPDEIASAVLYLAGAESAFVVGTELVVDGGMSQL
jgi:NAD(P)-dependent dehydrogenase (short-subunit alcohol dehydrogenase family)